MGDVIVFPKRERWQAWSEDLPRLDHAGQADEQQRDLGQRVGVSRSDAHHIACGALMIVPLTMACLSLVVVILAREILHESYRLLHSASSLVRKDGQSVPKNPGQSVAKVGKP